MPHFRTANFVALGVVVLIVAAARAEVRPAALFTDHMVLQRGMPLPIWGTADPGERVTVSMAGQAASTTAGADGRWRVVLEPLEMQDPLEMTISGEDTVTIRDVLVGEVWVCSGQSNMTFALNRAKNAEQEIASAEHPRIRLFDVQRVPSDTPLADVDARWQICTPQTAATFSAVAYFFGRDLQQAIDVPIGLIHSSWGGSVAQTWTPRATLEDPRFALVLKRNRERIEKLPQTMQDYNARRALWEATRAAAVHPSHAGPPPTEPPPAVHKNAPAHLYNGMIHPLVPYAIRGVVWYQGESNRFDPNHYRELLPEMIRAWRTSWTQSDPHFGADFPFIMVQIANYLAPTDDPNQRSTWAEIREVQRLTAGTLPNVGLVVTIDIGDAKDIHPTNKLDVGQRAAFQALRVAYGKDVVAGGPAFREARMKGDHVVIAFDASSGRLVARDSKLTGFTIAGDDRIFVEADAHIDGDRVVVSSPQVPRPVAVRYGWADNPPASLYNAEGLPAGPFRTDDWPWKGQVKR